MNKKVAIHTSPSITKSGHSCTNYPDSLVVVGSNPLGPRGGHNGTWVDGKVVARYKFGKRDKASEHVMKLVAEGYMLA